MEENNSFNYSNQLIPVPQSSRKDNTVCMTGKILVTKKESREILPEEQYVENLEKIIVRDYFPELPKLKVDYYFSKTQNFVLFYF